MWKFTHKGFPPTPAQPSPAHGGAVRRGAWRHGVWRGGESLMGVFPYYWTQDIGHLFIHRELCEYPLIHQTAPYSSSRLEN